MLRFISTFIYVPLVWQSWQAITPYWGTATFRDLFWTAAIPSLVAAADLGKSIGEWLVDN